MISPLLLVSIYIAYVLFGGFIFTLIEEDCTIKNRKSKKHDFSMFLCDDLNELFEKHKCNQNSDLQLLTDILKVLNRCDGRQNDIDFKRQDHCKNDGDKTSRNNETININTNNTKIQKRSIRLNNENNSTVENSSNNRQSIDAHDKYEHKQTKNKSCKKWTVANQIKWSTFSSSTIFTIGYGDVVPRSHLGKIAVMLYAIFGIPIAIAMVTTAGRIGVSRLTNMVNIVEKNYLNQTGYVLCGNEKKSYKNLKVSAAALSLFSVTVIGNGIISTNQNLDNMTWIDSLYFWFISVTTIGFGDIPINRQVYYGVNCLLYIPYIVCLIFGLGLMAVILNLLSETLLEENYMTTKD